jgi:exosome complex RNA-binding protein Csl4
MSKKVSVRLPDEMVAEIEETAKATGKPASQVIIEAIAFAIDDAKRRTTFATAYPLESHPFVQFVVNGLPQPAEIAEGDVSGGSANSNVCAKGDPATDVTIARVVTYVAKISTNFPEVTTSSAVEVVSPETFEVPLGWKEILRNPENAPYLKPNVAEEGTQTSDVPVSAEWKKEGDQVAETKKLAKCPDCGARLIPWGPGTMRCRTCERNW